MQLYKLTYYIGILLLIKYLNHLVKNVLIQQLITVSEDFLNRSLRKCLGNISDSDKAQCFIRNFEKDAAS